MYELQKVNQNILSDFSILIQKVIEKEKVHILVHRTILVQFWNSKE